MLCRNKKCVEYILLCMNDFGVDGMKTDLKNVKLFRTAEKTFRMFLRDSDLDVKEAFFMEMNSEGELMLRGIEDVNEYGKERMLLKSRDFYLEIKGENMLLGTYSANYTSIKGKIDSIAFLRSEV